MPRKKETLTLSVPPGTKAKLAVIAERLNIRWGNSPSPSGLVAALAEGSVEVGMPFRLSPPQVKALRQSVQDLLDAGHGEEARSVLTLLLDRGELAAPLRQSLIQQISQPLEGWRIQVDQFIQQQQPFHLVYRNAQGTLLEYSVRYAEIIFYEKRYYLQIWCDQTEDSQDFPELRHNRCLRLDRIQAVFPLPGAWRGQCDSMQVQFHLTGGLIRAYEPKDTDLQDTIIGEIRQIVRTVVNPFWLMREIRRYGSECVIQSPVALRDRFRQDLLDMLAQYEK
ncbi:MAG: WYL domain-containing protein [Elainella sp. Prado103]|jgi:predicted DNA-binding transcriptional regulator YafY|nr:WYL domain-containing protein [Elainella sp. Prado103]